MSGRLDPPPSIRVTFLQAFICHHLTLPAFDCIHTIYPASISGLSTPAETYCIAFVGTVHSDLEQLLHGVLSHYAHLFHVLLIDTFASRCTSGLLSATLEPLTETREWAGTGSQFFNSLPSFSSLLAFVMSL
jgi:hypothetical protein